MKKIFLTAAAAAAIVISAGANATQVCPSTASAQVCADHLAYVDWLAAHPDTSPNAVYAYGYYVGEDPDASIRLALAKRGPVWSGDHADK